MDIIQEVLRVYSMYRAEADLTLKGWAKKRDEFANKIKDIESQDFVSPYRDMYFASFQKLDDIYTSWKALEEKTFGLKEPLYKMVETYKARPLGDLNLEGYVLRIVKDVKESVNAVSKCSTVLEEVPYKKVFAQAFKDMMYVVDHSDELVVRFKMDQRDKEEASLEYKKEYEKYVQMIKDGVDGSTLKCHSEIERVRTLLQTIQDEANGLLIGNANEYPMDYKISLGNLITRNVPKEAYDFVKDYYKLNATLVLTRAPEFFDPKNTSKSTLLINYPSALVNSGSNFIKFQEFIQKIFFRFVANLSPKKILVAGLEKNDRIPMLPSIEVNFKSNVFNGSFAYDSTKFNVTLDALKAELNARMLKYGGYGFFAYNEMQQENQDPPILLLVNNYPYGFENNPSLIDKIDTFVNQGRYFGIFTVLLQCNDYQSMDKNTPVYKQSDCIDEITLIDFEQFLLNGKKLNMNVFSEDFNIMKYWEKLKSRSTSSNSVGLYDFVTNKVERTPEPFYKKMYFPIGRDGSKVANIDIEPNGKTKFILFVGKTGVGKTSFLHSLIFASCYLYSPQELQFYITDFKSDNAQESPHFLKYKEGRERYLPHIRYLSLANDAQAGGDLIAKIVSIKTQRARLFQKIGAEDFAQYNQMSDTPLPLAMFIVDECNQIFGHYWEEPKSKSNINAAKKMKELLNTLRSYGIGILLSGQSIPAAAVDFAAIDTRVAYSIKGGESDDRQMRIMFDVESEKAKQMLNKVNQVVGSCYLKCGNEEARYVNVAYGPDEATFTKLRDLILEKWKNESKNIKQEVSGSNELFLAKDLNRIESGSDDVIGHDLVVGVSSSSMVKVNLEFNKNAKGYFALIGNQNKMYKYEMGLFANYIYKHLHDTNYKDSKMYYMSSIGEKRNLFNRVNDDYQTDLFNKHITFIGKENTFEMDIARAIYGFVDEFNKRKREANNSGKSLFEPTYLVFKNIEWLFGDSDYWLNNDLNSEDDEVPTQAVTEEMINEEAERIVASDHIPLIIAKSLARKKLMSDQPKVEEKEVVEVSVSKTKKNLRDLYVNGPQFGIYCIFNFNRYTDLISAADFLNSSRDEPSNCIYGSLDEYTSKLDKPAPENTIYLTPNAIKLCLIDYDYNHNKEFWEENK